MNPKLKFAYFLTDLVLPLTIGYLLRRHTRLKESHLNRLTLVAILGFLPVMALLSFWEMDLNVGLIWLPLIGVAMQLIPGAVGFLRARAKYSSPLDQGSYTMAATLLNRGSVGMLTLFILYGERGYAYSQLVMLFSRVVVFLICFPTANYFRRSHDNTQGGPVSLRELFLNRNQVVLIGLLAGAVLNFAHVPRPAPLEPIFKVLVHFAVWLFILPIGYAIDFGEMRKYWRDALELLGIRFIINPLITYVIARAVGCTGDVLIAVVILSLAPTAVFAVITAKLYKLNVHLAMAAWILTHVAYIAVILPLIILML